MARKSSARPRSSGSGRVRIIAGKWGGRFLRFKNAAGLRPSGERVRETLFSWLQADLPGASVLDLFAGSGVLGLEAASRGASHVALVENNGATARQLREHIDSLNAKEVDLHQGSALKFLQTSSLRYDVIFVDPPFHGSLMEQTLAVLVEHKAQLTGAVIYLEFEQKHPPNLPDGWDFERFKEAGDVGFGVVRLPS
ncbi:MAG: 16S rRNA (guanine(966)-N(2))-methyltransferase RsmD [bacterium]